MRATLETVAAFVATLVASLLLQQLQGKQPTNIAILISTVSGLSVWLALFLIFIQGRRFFAPLRRFIDQRSEIEGYWFETVAPSESEGVGPYSILLFIYDPRQDQYNLRGWNFSTNGDVIREFQSAQIATQISAHSIHYYYTGDLLDPTTGEKIGLKGIGHAQFMRRNREVSEAKGLFLDHKKQTTAHDFTLTKITPGDIMRYAGNKGLEDEDDMKKYVVTYHIIALQRAGKLILPEELPTDDVLSADSLQSSLKSPE